MPEEKPGVADTFPCTQCGACCVMAGLIGAMPKREDGACIHLGHDNQCKIYDTRPTVCRVDKMMELRGANKAWYYKTTKNICNDFQERLGIDERYRL